MDIRKPRIAQFLQTILTDHGEQMRAVGQELIEKLPADKEFSPFEILTEASHQLAEAHLHDFEAMNLVPFGR